MHFMPQEMWTEAEWNSLKFSVILEKKGWFGWKVVEYAELTLTELKDYVKKYGETHR